MDVPDIDCNSRKKQAHSQRKKILDNHDDRKAQKRMKIEAMSGENDNGEHHNECVKHVDELARNEGNRDYLTWKINLFYQVSVDEYAVCARGNTRAEKNPWNEGNKQEEIVFFDLLMHQDRKNKCIYNKLKQGIQKSPEKTKYRAFIAPSELLMHQGKNHLPVLIDIRKQGKHFMIITYIFFIV